MSDKKTTIRLDDAQFKRVLEFVKKTKIPQRPRPRRHSAATRAQRNAVIVLLSFKVGLRAHEIAGLTWDQIKDDKLEMRNIPLNAELKDALTELHELEKKEGRGTAESFVITLPQGKQNVVSRAESIAYLFNGKAHSTGWFTRVGISGASSHCGRKTFITNAIASIHAAQYGRKF
jgi:integrase/recombinase XerD